MFKGGKIPEEPIIINRKVCVKCNQPISWGRFAYDQNMCWKCFEERIYRIARNTETLEDMKMVLHLLKIADEVFNRRI